MQCPDTIGPGKAGSTTIMDWKHRLGQHRNLDTDGIRRIEPGSRTDCSHAVRYPGGETVFVRF